MIKLHRLNKQEFMLNSDLIEHIDELPDTTISMMSGRKFIVEESAEEVRKHIIAFRKEAGARFAPVKEDEE